jgi:hypothetical protein
LRAFGLGRSHQIRECVDHGRGDLPDQSPPANMPLKASAKKDVGQPEDHRVAHRAAGRRAHFGPGRSSVFSKERRAMIEELNVGHADSSDRQEHTGVR